MTNKEAKRLIREAEKNRVGPNRTRWYTTVHPKRNGEAKLRTWAVKTWDGKPLVMLAAEYDTGGGTNHVSGRCLVHYLGMKVFNWLDYGGPSHLAVWSDVDSARDEWCEAYPHETFKGAEFFGLGDFLNGFEGTKYKYCGYEHLAGRMRVTDFLDCYRVSPMAEVLAKNGLVRWLRPSHVKRLAADKGLLKALARHRELWDVSPSDFLSAYGKMKRGAFDFEGFLATVALRRYHLDGLPLSHKRVVAWASRNGVSLWALETHVRYLRELGMDLSYEPHVIPKDFATYSLAIKRRVDEAREERKAYEEECVRKARIDARRIIQSMVDEGKLVPRCTAVVPYSETEFVKESQAMNNCMRLYYGSVKSGRCDVVFIRKDGKPYIDLCVTNGKISEVRYNHNRPLDEGEDMEMCRMIASAFSPKKVA